MRNIKITVQYNGGKYCGWQSQPDSVGIQGAIENAYYEITKEKIKVIGSGRTDSGVHALGQVANFTTESSIDVDKIPNALNSKLSKDISIVDAEEVDVDFHARYSAKRKCYRYMIYNNRYRNPIVSGVSYQVKYGLDFDKMKIESKSLIGTYDFKGFMSSGSQVKSTVRTIYDVRLHKNEDMIVLEIEGNGFLYNMVRIIVGTLVDIGRGRIAEPLSDVIESKDRGRAGHTAPACGLFLKKVFY